MKKILRNIIVSGVAIVMFGSCDMNLTPTTQIAYDENEPLFTNEADVVQFMNGVMSSYRALQYDTFSQTPDLMCDGFNAVIGYGNQYGPVHRTDDSFTSSDGYTESMWRSNYSAIKNYNIVIAGANRKDVPEELKEMVDIVKGYALFCRASSYLNLARYYGKDYDPDTAEEDLCVAKVTEYDQLAKPGRSTVQEIYDLIYDDLSEAEDLLQFETGTVGAMYPTIDAVRALMARYFLDTHQYDYAYDYAMRVINTKKYELSNTIDKMNAEFTSDYGTEPILQLYASKAEGAVANSIYTPVERDDVGKFIRALFLPSANLLNAYDAGDLRFTTWFSNSLYPVFVQGTRYNGVTVFTKYLGNPDLTTGNIETGAHAAKPLMIAEMYLIAAEAYSMDGEDLFAKDVLNELRTARKAKLSTTGSLEDIQQEWLRETVGDGQRLICLKRWGKGFSGRPPQPAAVNLIETGTHFDEKEMLPEDRAFTWPIPAYELKLNTNLNPQNDGYSAN